MTQAVKSSVCIECSCIVIKFNTYPTHFKKTLIRRPVDYKTKRPNFIVLNIKFVCLPALACSFKFHFDFYVPIEPIECLTKSAHHHFGSHYHKSRSFIASGRFSEF